MVNQPKRIEVDDAANGVGGQSSARFGPGTGTIIRRLTNYHNIWFGFQAETISATANAHGLWVLWLKANTNDPDTVWSITEINSQNTTMQIIACGVWAASNESPYTFSSQLKTSRNLVANQELVFTVHVLGVTAGLVQLTKILCASLSVK